MFSEYILYYIIYAYCIHISWEARTGIVDMQRKRLKLLCNMVLTILSYIA